MLAKRKRETERDERKRAFSSFRSFITSKRDTHRERECEKNKKATSSFIIGAFADRKQTQHTSKKKERFSSAGATHLLNLPHLDVLLLVVAHGRHLVLFLSLSLLFSLFCVCARETKEVVLSFFEQREPPADLLKKK